MSNLNQMEFICNHIIDNIRHRCLIIYQKETENDHDLITHWLSNSVYMI